MTTTSRTLPTWPAADSSTVTSSPTGYLNLVIANHAAVHELANDTVAAVTAPFTSY
jgi:hypothetical protein